MMLKYKTTTIPSYTYTGVKPKEFRMGLTTDTANRAIAPVGECIEAEALGGWMLHSVFRMPQRISRKKTVLELLFGWIPFLGNLLFPTMVRECKHGEEFDMFVLTFVREE